MADPSLVGQVGEVVVRIGGDDRPGEIVAVSHGIREEFIAYADEPHDIGTSVLVVGIRGPRQVDVIAADPLSPLSEPPASDAPQ
jgi:hypothetical protein